MTLKQAKKYEYIFVSLLILFTAGIIIYIWQNHPATPPNGIWFFMGFTMVFGILALYFQGKHYRIVAAEKAKTAKLGEVAFDYKGPTTGQYTKELNWASVSEECNCKNRDHIVTNIEIFQHQIIITYKVPKK